MNKLELPTDAFLSIRAALLISVLILGASREFETITGYQTGEILDVIKKMDNIYSSCTSENIEINLNKEEAAIIFHTLLNYISGTGEYKSYKCVTNLGKFDLKAYFFEDFEKKLKEIIVRMDN